MYKDTNDTNVEMKKRGLPIGLVIGIAALIIVTVVIIVIAVSASGDSKAKTKEKMDLGMKYLSELNYEQAIVAFNEAIEIDPKNVDAYIRLAEVYVLTDNYDKAEETLEKAEKETGSDLVREKKEEVKKAKEEKNRNDVSSEPVTPVITEIDIPTSKPTLTDEPVSLITPEPTQEITIAIEPSLIPTPTPSPTLIEITLAPEPTATPTPEPTARPTASPTPSPTPEPTVTSTDSSMGEWEIGTVLSRIAEKSAQDYVIDGKINDGCKELKTWDIGIVQTVHLQIAVPYTKEGTTVYESLTRNTYAKDEIYNKYGYITYEVKSADEAIVSVDGYDNDRIILTAHDIGTVNFVIYGIKNNREKSVIGAVRITVSGVNATPTPSPTPTEEPEEEIFRYASASGGVSLVEVIDDTIDEADISETADGRKIVSIGEEAFTECSNLETVSIGSSVKNIGEYAFYECANLEKVTISGATKIEAGAFADCYSLTSVSLPSTLTYIGENAFSGCESIQYINIPSSVTFIGDDAFYECGSNFVIYANNDYVREYCEDNEIDYR